MAQYLNETFSSGSFLDGKSADVGGTWSNPANNWGTADPSISGGRVNFDTTSPYSYINSATPGDSLQDVSLEFMPNADNWLVGCVARYQTTGGAQILCWLNSSTFTIVKLASGTDWPGTTLCTATPTLAAGDRASHTLRLKVDAAGAMSVWLDGSPVTMTGTTTDNTLTASGSKSGFWGRGGSSTQITADDGTTVAATLSSPIANATGPTQATIGVTTDTPPTTTAISYQILPAATGAPSAATIVGAPDGTITTGSVGALTKAITGLTTNTAVKVHFAQGSTSNVVSTASFTPSTLASSGTPAAQTGTAGGSITWTGATPDSFITNHGNGSGSWSIVSSAGFTVAPSINAATGVLSGGTLSSAGTYAPQIRYTDSSTVPSAQQINFTLSLTVSAGADTTPPTLSSPSASGGALTCAGSVSTNEGNGTLYTVFCASGTPPTAVQVEAGQDSTGSAALRAVSQAVTGTGTQTVASGAITAGTRYAYFMHKDAAGNRSTVAASAIFTVTSGADTTPPTMSAASVTGGTLSATGSITSNEAGTLWWKMDGNATAADPGAGSESGAGWTSQSMSAAANSVNFGTQPAGLRYAHFIGVDAAGNRASVVNASGTVSSGVGGTITSQPLGNNDRVLLPNKALTWLGFRDYATGNPVLLKTGVVTDSSAQWSVTDVALTQGSRYLMDWLTVDGDHGRADAVAS